jgi:hypothetical protein
MHTLTVNALHLLFGGMLCFAVGGLVTYQTVTMTLVTTDCAAAPPASEGDEALRRFLKPGLLPMDQGKRY